ncbi:unnamed protein product [Calypogeia fissa]
MPTKQFPLPRSPLGPEQMKNNGTHEERWDLLSPSGPYQPLTTPRFEMSPGGRDFKVYSPTGTLSPPLLPSTGPTGKRQRIDPEALPLFASHEEQSHRNFEAESLLPREFPMTTKQVSRTQTLKDMEGMDAMNLPHRRLCRRRCFCCFVLFAIFSVALALTFVYLAERPKSPTLQMKVLDITSFKYEGGVDGKAPLVAAGLKFSLEEVNPNKEAELVYDQVRIELKYQGFLLGNISIPGFKQHKRSNRTLVIELPETLTAIDDPGEALKFREEVTLQNIQTDLNGAVVGHFKMWGIRVKKFHVPVDCKLNVEPESGNQPAKLLSSSCYYYPT